MTSDSCLSCGGIDVERHRIRRDRRRPVLEVLACSTCGEFRLEGDGAPLTPERLRDLGLLP